jgi:hypothetical protein
VLSGGTLSLRVVRFDFITTSLVILSFGYIFWMDQPYRFLGDINRLYLQKWTNMKAEKGGGWCVKEAGNWHEKRVQKSQH